jgi:Sulfatase
VLQDGSVRASSGRSHGRLWLLLGLITLALGAAAPAAGQQPNLVFVLTDDQRLETIEMMPETIAAFGVEFTRFVVTTPTCCPSRATYLTGRWAHSRRAYDESRGIRSVQAA